MGTRPEFPAVAIAGFGFSFDEIGSVVPCAAKPVVGAYVGWDAAVVSRTSSFGFRGRSLWARTEALQVLLALMVEAAEKVEARDEPWLEELLEHWRVQASVPDLGCTLDDAWSPEQLSLVKDLIDSVRRELREPDALLRVTHSGWSVLDDIPVADGFRTERQSERVDEVADAMLQLLDETLPPNPPGAWWFVGLAEGEWRHIKMRYPQVP